MSARLHVAAGTDRHLRFEWICLAPKGNVSERRSDRLDSNDGLSAGHTPGEQRRGYFGEFRLYVQGLLPRDLLQRVVPTTTAEARALNFDVWGGIYRLTQRQISRAVDWSRDSPGT